MYIQVKEEVAQAGRKWCTCEAEKTKAKPPSSSSSSSSSSAAASATPDTTSSSCVIH